MGTAINVGPGVLSIGEPDALVAFQSQTIGCRLVPSVNRGDAINLLDGSTVAGDRTESWQLRGNHLQDLGAQDSRTEYLFTHRGQEQPFTFTPSTAAGTSFSGVLIVEAVEMGGDAKTKPTSEFQFDLVGSPSMTPGGAMAAQASRGDDDELVPAKAKARR
jgi:hypothetical protein